MHRNPDLMMKLLDACALGNALTEDDDKNVKIKDALFPADEVKYHLSQLEQAGFVLKDNEAKKDPMAHLRTKKAIELKAYCVTPKGHDRLAIKSEQKIDIWS